MGGRSDGGSLSQTDMSEKDKYLERKFYFLPSLASRSTPDSLSKVVRNAGHRLVVGFV